MSGSGNDFVMIDAMTEPAGGLTEAKAVQAIGGRAPGVGAAGLAVTGPSAVADFRMAYLNADGSRADLCGNASLCSSRLARELGIIGDASYSIETDAGVLRGRFLPGGPEVDLEPVTEVRTGLSLRLAPGERWVGFAQARVPHLVVRVDDVLAVEFVRRGRPLRPHASLPLRAHGNFLSHDAPDGR